MTHLAHHTFTGRTPSMQTGKLIAGAALSLLLASCGESDKIALYPVTGSVKFGNQVPAGAQVVLQPVGPALPDNLAPNGTVGADGKFTIGTYDKTDGAPSG